MSDDLPFGPISWRRFRVIWAIAWLGCWISCDRSPWRHPIHVARVAVRMATIAWLWWQLGDLDLALHRLNPNLDAEAAAFFGDVRGAR